MGCDEREETLANELEEPVRDGTGLSAPSRSSELLLSISLLLPILAHVNCIEAVLDCFEGSMHKAETRSRGCSGSCCVLRVLQSSLTGRTEAEEGQGRRLGGTEWTSDRTKLPKVLYATMLEHSAMYYTVQSVNIQQGIMLENVRISAWPAPSAIAPCSWLQD